jgi:uncharacterized protein (DUF305 family)
MKNNFFLKRPPMFLSLLLLAGQLANAQHMPDHHQVSSPKNIFLAMMDTMMVKMDDAPAGESTGACFILQMIPHHEGAIAMANYEIAYGKDFTIIQLAKSILIEQTYEIQQMRLWLRQSLPDTAKTTADFKQAMNQTMSVMMQNMPANNILTDIDRAFARVMIPHHQAAVDMAKVAIKFTADYQTNAFAKNIISSQQIEIEQMFSFLKK